MLIAFPVTDQSDTSTISPSFGRAPYFLLYDTNTKETHCYMNTAVDAAGGAGIAAAQSLADRKIEVLVTPRCGENAAQVLMRAGIRLYASQGVSVTDNLALYAKGELLELTDIHPGYHHHGGR